MKAALLTNGLGERRALPWRSLTVRQQALWQLLPEDVSMTAGLLRLEHREELIRIGCVDLRSTLNALAILQAAGWADNSRAGGWIRRTPEPIA